MGTQPPAGSDERRPRRGAQQEQPDAGRDAGHAALPGGVAGRPLPNRPAFVTIGVATQPMDEPMTEETSLPLAQLLVAAHSEMLVLRTTLVLLLQELPTDTRSRVVASLSAIRQLTDDADLAALPGFNAEEEALHNTEVAIRRLVAMINKEPVPPGKVLIEPPDDLPQ